LNISKWLFFIVFVTIPNGIFQKVPHEEKGSPPFSLKNQSSYTQKKILLKCNLSKNSPFEKEKKILKYKSQFSAIFNVLKDI